MRCFNYCKKIRQYLLSEKNTEFFTVFFTQIFAIVIISDIFSAYFFVNFCLKIWKNYTHWKKIAKFYGNIYYCKFFWEILPIFRWKIFHCTKKITFFYTKYCRKIFNAKITAKVCEKKLRKNKRKTFQSHTSQEEHHA